jgi:hypothetical protein
LTLASRCRSLRSDDDGRSWVAFADWSRHSPNEILPLPNGSFVVLPYSLAVDYATNHTASGALQTAHIDTATGEWVTERSFTARWHAPPPAAWPFRLVHSGSVVPLKDGSHLTTAYGHGEGGYRHWTQRAAVYFLRSADLGASWTLVATVPWQAAYGDAADGPGEPSTARLADGRLMCVFRADSTSYYWATHSADEGATWSAPRRLDFAWSVKPRLRLTRGGVLVLTGGRPGIDLWASADGGESWARWNLAAEHNARAGALGANATYGAQVLNASGPTVPRANPPQTSSYTGMAEAGDGALVVSYDRLANGWAGPPGAWGECDMLFTMRVTFAVAASGEQ